MFKLIISFLILIQTSCYTLTSNPIEKKIYFENNFNINKNTKKYDLNLETINKIIYNNNNGFLSTLSCNKITEGFPYGSLVAFSIDTDKNPFFCFSKLSTHTKNLIKESKSSLCLIDNKFNGLQDFRFTITGNIIKQQNKGEYIEKYEYDHPNDFWIRFDDFDIYKMEEIIDINFVGGFANAGKIKIKDYYSS
jgi:hypothetical protein